MGFATARTLAGGGGVAAQSTFQTFLPVYWDAVLAENLYPNLVFYAFGTKRQIPRNFGSAIKIPRFRKKSGVVSRALGIGGSGTSTSIEGNAVLGVVGTCPAGSEFVSGTLKQFIGVYRHSDIVVMTALSDVVNLSLKDIARDMALQMDTHIRDTVSGTGRLMYTAGTSLATSGGGNGTTNMSILKSIHIARSSGILDSANNPRPAGGHYPMVIHPAQQFDLQSSLTGNSWLEINKYKGNEEPENLYRAELGRIFGCVLTTSTNIKQIVGEAVPGRQFGGVCVTKSSGWMAYAFAPEPYYVTEISDMTAKTYVKQLGSAGAFDPVNTVATVGAKVFFTAIPATFKDQAGTANSEVRMVRIVAGGKTL